MPGEYRGDFTRDTFRRSKHFLRVLSQQGRVSIEADWNEQTAILVHHLQTVAADVFGAHGGSHRRGFEISPLATSPPGGPQHVSGDFLIGPGRYYVNGILCEVEGPSVPITGFPQHLQPGQHGVIVPALTLDGRPFANGDYVEIYHTAGGVPPIIAKIDDVHPTHGTLILDSRASGPLATLRLRRATTYLTQPDYPASHRLRTTAHATVVYLDVWERNITCVQDDGIREVALGTADTATRSKIVWQVKYADLDIDAHRAKHHYGEFLEKLLKKLERDDPPGALKARATPDAPSTDPCTLAPDARYRGVENQLYRVTVHSSGNATNDPKTCATFKWSRENGSVVFPIVSGSGTNVLTLEHVGRDERSTLRKNDLVEAQDDVSALEPHTHRAPHLLTVLSVDDVSMQVTLSGPALAGTRPGMHPVLIRWEHDPESKLLVGDDNAAMIVEGTGSHHWLALEDGIEIQFQEPIHGGRTPYYRSGDYWLIPARTATGDVEWPIELHPDGTPVLDAAGNHIPVAQRPHGIEHHYAPLAVIDLDASLVVKQPVEDCRRRFTFRWR